ncbi:germin-like protein subfamily 1 member 17 isoform X1 [Lycium ferocissimum]|uniref:germin-like protein subfamily 1 member 17 isoform X1 n=1 Tax=Lycium ferocissimum TaxID=112874 RepID=UPI0028158D09|nr:germin-like protein subfamily 1 member 17 isoform X1 [Lycium ferocissimum]
MEQTSAISMTMHLLISIIFLSSFACAYHLKNPKAAVQEEDSPVGAGHKAGSKLANADDFFASGLHASHTPVPNYDVFHSVVDANKIPALKDIAMSMVRVDLEPSGRTPINLHPQSSKLILVLEGTIFVGFLVPDPIDRIKSQLVSKILNPGDVFVVPQGLIHFLYNVGDNAGATIFEFLNNLNYYIPTIIPNPIFASDPPIDDDFLAKSFRLDKSVIEDLRKKFP